MVALIAQRSFVAVSDLAEELDVSLPTVRRDLRELEQQQLVSRTHGGATPHVAFNDVPLRLKAGEAQREKARIAAYAADMLEGAAVIGMSGGTTMTEFAKRLTGRSGLTVVTNAINIASDLAATTQLRVFSAGGEIRHSSLESVGRAVERFFGDYNIDIAFIGVDGIDAEAGCTNYDPAGALANDALLNRGKKRVVLADATKIGRIALAPLCPVSKIDLLVTDSSAPADAVGAIRQAGCDVVCV